MSLTTLVTPLGAGMYRLEETEFMAELNHHDIIQAEDLGSSRLRYVGVIQRSELTVNSGIFSPDFLESAELVSALNWLTERGGYWQREMGGILLLSIPKDAETDFDARWDRAADSFRRPGRRWLVPRVQQWLRGLGLIPLRATESVKSRTISTESAGSSGSDRTS